MLTRLPQLTTVVSVVFVSQVCLGACAMPNGMNDACQWPDEAAFTADLQDRAHRKHLVDDARVIEELVVRHTDAQWGHGPSVNKRQTRDACFARLFADVARVHDVTVADVETSRARLREDRFDAAVHLPMAALYVVMTIYITGRVYRRFSGDESLARLVSTLGLSVAASVVMVFIGLQWAGVVEMIRVGNDHLSFRGDNIAWRRQIGELFAAGVLIYWAVAIVHSRVDGGSASHLA